MQHTKGPWYTASTGNHQGLIISEATGENVAVSYDAKDARLIATSPKLLQALEIVFAMLDRPDAERDENRVKHIVSNAINEAKGGN